jgi:23S rRNA (cytosine1962-C5)-methyltransferase
MPYKKIVLGKGKEFSMQRRHPWIFSGAIAKKDSDLKDGELVEVFSSKQEYLATGYYANGSIAIRVISFEQTDIDERFWEKKISTAWDYRKSIGILDKNTNCCRIFFGEGDGVPGLVLDYFDGHIVLQSHSYGVYLQRDKIAAALQAVLGPAMKSLYDKSAETLGKQFAGETSNHFLYGSSEPEITVKENGHLFLVDMALGQKTGFFLDQRDNRELLGKYSRGKNVLNTFSYTGGFSVYAAAAGAAKVVSVDVSRPAMDLCNRNIEINGLRNHEGVAEDTFEYLKDKKDQFDLIVLDPPAFAKSRDAKHNAVIGYKRLNAMAMKQIRKGGIIFTFSCSGVVDKFLFYNTITAAALDAGREVRILQYLTQPADHPVTPFFPEGEYLKGVVLRVL